MSMPALPVERLAFSVHEFARAIGVSHPMVYRALRTGELASFQFGRRRLISREAAEQFIRKRQQLEEAGARIAERRVPR